MSDRASPQVLERARAILSLRPLLALPLLLAACGDLPQPFAGNPGRTARRLSQPPPARLVVQPADAALLPDAATKSFATALAEALVAREVPAVPAYGRKGEWRLATTAELASGRVTPTFAVQDPQGGIKGAVQGAPVPAAEWQAADPAMLRREAVAAAPAISALLDRIEAARQESDPNSLRNRPTRVAVTTVTGAPGDGDASLRQQIVAALVKRGQEMRERPEDADYVVAATVRAIPQGKGLTIIDLEWTVTDAQGREAGKVSQVNEVPDQAISGLWGDVAIAAAGEAAGGVRDVIQRQLEGREPAAPPARAGS